MNGIGVILLAAGGSTRLGTPKQFIEINGQALVRLMAERLLALPPDGLLVIVGAHAERMKQSLAGLGLEIIENGDWANGIGTSIALGAGRFAETQVSGVVIALCDQPAIPPRHFRTLCDRFSAVPCDIVASEYAGRRGVPAVFAHRLLPRLAAMSGDRGAKSLLYDSSLRIECVACDEAAIDLDTPADLESFRSGEQA